MADLNRDGWLDLIVGNYKRADSEATELAIYYGSSDGFSLARRAALTSDDRTIRCLLADFDRDGWLDLVNVGDDTNQVKIYRGGPDGFHLGRTECIPIPRPSDAETADLNNDGWLDLIVASSMDPVARVTDTGLMIFWGGPRGFQQANAQWLPGWYPVGIAMADLDGDGLLDIVSPHYHGANTREDLPCYIYWGGKNGYAVKNRTSLSVHSSHDVMIGDYDGDKRLDLAFGAHSDNDGHLVHSPIYLNDGHRFVQPKVQYLPTVGPHSMTVQDIGNIMHRRFEETYDSPVFTYDADASLGRVEAVAKYPFGTQLDWLVRSAAETAALPAAAWRRVQAGKFHLAPTDRVLQYRAVFLSSNGDSFPVLDAVGVTLFH